MRWMRTRLDETVAALVAAVLPGRCAGCGRAAEPVCPECASGLRRAPRLALPPTLDGWVAPFAYEGVAREIVARLKYRNERGAIPFLADAMSRAFRAEQASEDATVTWEQASEDATVTWEQASEDATVTWAPASANRRHASGFDHGELLARAVARRLDLPVARLLTRGPGPPQTGRSRAQRSPGPPLCAVTGRAPGRSIVLVDDVVTTGATLGAAAVALRRAGAFRVVALTAAATPSRRPGGGSPPGDVPSDLPILRR
jgi:predicted amidophosphoribosyltransferase